MRTIDVHQLKADLEAGIVPVLIDVRTPAEYASGHVDAAITVPLQTIPEKMTELEAYKGNTVYMICKAGGRSANACQFLSAHGFDVVNVMGGTGGWINAGYPVT